MQLPGENRVSLSLSLSYPLPTVNASLGKLLIVPVGEGLTNHTVTRPSPLSAQRRSVHWASPLCSIPPVARRPSPVARLPSATPTRSPIPAPVFPSRPTASPMAVPSPALAPASGPAPCCLPASAPVPTAVPAITPAPSASPTPAPSLTGPSVVPASAPVPIAVPAITPAPSASPTLAPSITGPSVVPAIAPPTSRLSVTPVAAPPTPGPCLAPLDGPVASSPRAAPTASPDQLLPDALGALVQTFADQFRAAGSWIAFLDAVREPTDLTSTVGDIAHPAGPLLDQLGKVGAPVVMNGDPWSSERIEAALKRGPHQSAKEHVAFLRDEFRDMILKGHWIVLPARLVKDLPGIRLSPLGVVPQRDRRPRTICDYSFSQVNEETAAVAPFDSMQFGRALSRVLHTIAHANPRYGPVWLSKIDVSDAFYRIPVKPEDVLKLGVVFPSSPEEEQLVCFPPTLPMGWVHSPPYFTAASETIADLSNNMDAKTRAALPPHRLEEIADTAPSLDVPWAAPLSADTAVSVPPPWAREYFQRPVCTHDVYVDDFLALCQGPKRSRQQLRRALFHSFDTVFRPLTAGDNAFRQEPISVKKLLKGDGAWATQKVLLGWFVDTIAGTISLPPHRLERFGALLDSIAPTQRRIGIKAWHKFLGELRSMVLGLPGTSGLFGPLQHAFREHMDNGSRLKLSQHVHTFLNDFRWLRSSLASRPTRINELVPQRSVIPGSTDAAGTGMGGVAFLPRPDGQFTPIVWREPFPDVVSSRLVSSDNPTGTITNSDLELAGSIAHHDVVAHICETRERTLHTVHDNIAAVSWQRRGSTTTTGPTAYLLRLQSLHQRFHRYVHLHNYMPGEANVMSDDASRLWNLSDDAFLNHFNSIYPQPSPWILCRLRPEMNCSLTSALLNMASKPELFLAAPPQLALIGQSGANIVTPLDSIPFSQIVPIPYKSWPSSPYDIDADSLPPAKSPSDVVQWMKPFVPWVRRSPAWGPAISDSTLSDDLTCASSASYKASKN